MSHPTNPHQHNPDAQGITEIVIKQSAEANDSRPASCPAVEIKDWTAEDARPGAVIASEDGRLWNIQCVEFDGSVHVTTCAVIAPEDRQHWTLFKTNA